MDFYSVKNAAIIQKKELEAGSKKVKKFKNIEEELFSADEFIQGNKDIKRKWYIQSLNNLRKVEKRFRKVYLKMEFEDL